MEKNETKLLRRRAVEAITGLGRSSLYAKVASGEFPKPIQLGVRAVAWISSEIDNWISERIKRSRDASQKRSR